MRVVLLQVVLLRDYYGSTMMFGCVSVSTRISKIPVLVRALPVLERVPVLIRAFFPCPY